MSREEHHGLLFHYSKFTILNSLMPCSSIHYSKFPIFNSSVTSLAMESEGTLNNQERGKDWEYRVIAVNKAGEGVPSNTVAAVV